MNNLPKRRLSRLRHSFRYGCFFMVEFQSPPRLCSRRLTKDRFRHALNGASCLIQPLFSWDRTLGAQRTHPKQVVSQGIPQSYRPYLAQSANSKLLQASVAGLCVYTLRRRRSLSIYLLRLDRAHSPAPLRNRRPVARLRHKRVLSLLTLLLFILHWHIKLPPIAGIVQFFQLRNRRKTAVRQVFVGTFFRSMLVCSCMGSNWPASLPSVNTSTPTITCDDVSVANCTL